MASILAIIAGFFVAAAIFGAVIVGTLQAPAHADLGKIACSQIHFKNKLSRSYYCDGRKTK